MVKMTAGIVKVTALTASESNFAKTRMLILPGSFEPEAHSSCGLSAPGVVCRTLLFMGRRLGSVGFQRLAARAT
jgi:hypothetical protein